MFPRYAAAALAGVFRRAFLLACHFCNLQMSLAARMFLIQDLLIFFITATAGF